MPNNTKRKCRNCNLNSKGGKCLNGGLGVCRNWKPVEELPDWWPDWTDMRQGIFDDMVVRQDTIYLS